MTTLGPELLETLFGDGIDDRTRTLLTLLSSQEEANDEEETHADDLLNTRTSERAARGRLLQRQYREMAAELDELRFRNGALAEALGACPNCWGETPECSECGGQGSPGSFPVDPELFAAVVEPVVRIELSGDQPKPNEKGATDA